MRTVAQNISALVRGGFINHFHLPKFVKFLLNLHWLECQVLHSLNGICKPLAGDILIRYIYDRQKKEEEQGMKDELKSHEERKELLSIPFILFF